MTEATLAPTMRHVAKPPPGTRVIADVRASNKEGGGVQFTVQWRWADGTAGGNGAIEVPEKKKGQKATPIDFHLHDETKPPRGFVFNDDAEGPIWVRRDSCPDSQCLDAEIPSDKVNRTDKKLTIVDRNRDQCRLHYRLRFKDKTGTPDSLDPEIKNGGTT